MPTWNVRVFTGLILTGLAGLACYMLYARNESEPSFHDAKRAGEFEQTLSKAQTTPSSSDDWPQWRGVQRDGAVSTSIQTHWGEGGPKELWRVKVGPSYSSIVAAQGRAFAFFRDPTDPAREVLACYQASDGKELWRFAYEAKYQVEYDNIPRSTPTIDGDYIYTVGGGGEMHCLSIPEAGRVVWRKNLLTTFGATNLRWGTAFSPLVDGDFIYVMPGGPQGRCVAALDKRDGTTRWQALDDNAGYSSPMPATFAGRKQIVFFTATRLVGLDPATGEFLWDFAWPTEHGVNAATPIIKGDYIFIASGYGKGCALLKIEADEGRFRAERVFENRKMQNHFSTSVLVGDCLYGFNNEIFTCMRLGGAAKPIAWQERGFDKGSLLAAGNCLVVLGEQGQVAVVNPTPEKLDVLSRWQFSDKRCWSMPTLADSRLFLRDTETLVCFDVKR